MAPLQHTLQEFLALDTVELTPVEKASGLCFIRQERFIEGYYVKDNLFTLYHRYFGDTNVLQSEGLEAQYLKLKDDIVANKKIGMMHASINYSEKNNRLIDYYPSINNSVITLNLKNISRCLYYKYFTENERNTLSRETHNFNIYYNPDNNV